MSHDIEVCELRALSVSADGTAFRIGLADSDRRDVGLVFPSDALKALMLSLFRVGDTAFKRLLNDDSARLVYPAETCRLQAASGMDGRIILVLQSADGFEAAFALAPETAAGLARAIDEARPTTAEPVRLN